MNHQRVAQRTNVVEHVISRIEYFGGAGKLMEESPTRLVGIACKTDVEQ